MPTRKDRGARNAPVPSRESCYLIDPTFTLDGHGRARPAVAADHLGDLLTRVSATYGPAGLSEGVLLLSDAATATLGLPDTPPDADTAAAPYAAVAAAETHGWTAPRTVADWMTFTAAGRGAVHLGVLPMMRRRRCRHCACQHPECDKRHPLGACGCPLLTDDLIDVTAGFSRWHALTGRAWHHSSGVAGTSVFKSTMRNGPGRPTVKPREQGPPRRAAQEPEMTWAAPADVLKGMRGRYLDKFDAVRAYVAAAGVVMVAPGPLRHTGLRTFDPLLPGWWLAEIPTWGDPRLPHPAGRRRALRTEGGGKVRKEIRWVTTPTMVLLADLAEQGRIGETFVLDSWTGAPWNDASGQGGKRLFRTMTEILGDAFKAGPDPVTDPADVVRVRQAVKLAGRAVLGMYANDRNWIYRPDWWFHIVAMARCNMWRKLDAAALRYGIYPTRVDTDAAYYLTDAVDPAQIAPDVFKVGDGFQLGTFRHERWELAA